MTDLSFKLSDVEHTRSNITHAMNLLRTTGLDEDALVGKLYEAASITRQQGNVRKRAGPGNVGVINRAPYFWAVVADLLGMKDHPPPQPSGPGGGSAPLGRLARTSAGGLSGCVRTGACPRRT